jgi:hypothetical protein
MHFAAETGKIKKRLGALTDRKYEFCISKLFIPTNPKPIEHIHPTPCHITVLPEEKRADLSVKSINFYRNITLELQTSDGAKDLWYTRDKPNEKYEMPTTTRLIKIEHFYSHDDDYGENIEDVVFHFEDGTEKSINGSYYGHGDLFELQPNERLVGAEIH